MRITESDLTVLVNKVRGGESVVKHGTVAASRVSRQTPQQGRASGTGQPIKLAQVTAPSPQYRSKWEEQFAYELTMEKRAGLIKAFWYEPFSLWLPGKVRFKPDFMVQRNYQTNSYFDLELIEVKGWSKNRRDGMTRLKIAAALFPCFVWRLVYRTRGGGWNGEYV